ncbi:reverse transcriptase domain-containing protein [Kordiimonas sp.]|uniref:reverse transcriptase domain-containing protein n=1 Tax=Kordiimonas sp. TaxID=1970157 RepID=UPI003A8CF2F9
MKLNNIFTSSQLAQEMGVSHHDQLLYYLYKKPIDTNYTVFEMEKRGGGTRTIAAPHTNLKLLQKAAAKILNEEYTPKKPVFGFVKDRSIIDNADRHVRAKWILNVDLKDFFGSIHFGRIYGTLRSPPYSAFPAVARILAHMSCYKTALAQGAPCSPVLSNMVAKPLDNALIKYCRGHGVRYSRYADDITISTTRHQFPPAIAFIDNVDGDPVVVLGEKLVEIVEEDCGFKINHKKTRLLGKSERQTVTGLVVNEKVNVDRRYIRNLRAMLFDWEISGYEAAAKKHFENRSFDFCLEEYAAKNFEWVARGKIEFLRSVRGGNFSAFRTLAKRFNGLIEGTEIPIIQVRTSEEVMASICWVLRTTFEKDKSGESYDLDSTVFFTECGHAITSAHGVLPSQKFGAVEKIEIFDPNNLGFSYEVSIDKICADRDVATLKIDNIFVRLNKLKLADEITCSRLKRGETIFVAGFPKYHQGDEVNVSKGTITRPLKKKLGENKELPRFVTDVDIVRGTSGGPVFNESLEIIGVALEGPNDQFATHPSQFVTISEVRDLLVP